MSVKWFSMDVFMKICVFTKKKVFKEMNLVLNNQKLQSKTLKTLMKTSPNRCFHENLSE